jgi:Fe-Mn family superoxide dismutase
MFALPVLPYTYDALEPYIDAKTMEIHHSKHHQAYVDKLNAALRNHPVWEKKALEEIIATIYKVPEEIKAAVRNNAGGHYNHSLYWPMMKAGGGGEPRGELADALKMMYGSPETFREAFTKAALAHFGSGWVWLVRKNHSALEITSTPNQDNPLMKGLVDVEGTPLLGLDVWEHAYYLKYQNRRAEYIEAWWQVVNWDEAQSRFKE